MQRHREVALRSFSAVGHTFAMNSVYAHRNLIAHVGALLLLVAGLLFIVYRGDTVGELPETIPVATTTVPTATSTSSTALKPGLATSTTTSTAEKEATLPPATSTPKTKKTTVQASKTAATTSPNDILRIENPYATPPLPFESINISARSALVNIYCSTQSGSALKPITGSGIMIDPRGIVLTNAHVAQYVLLSQGGNSDLTCTVRTGAPAVAKWIPVVMYIPPVWIEQHTSDIIRSHVIGTGEHDYALLYMVTGVGGTPLPPSFAYVSPDIREAVAFVDDNVLAASYPVEFVGGSVIQSDLYPVSSIATIRKLMTFTIGKADAISLGGIIGAQSGSSGGAVVNQWGRLVGLITTTSEGATTGERDLHAITTGYINRDLITQTGVGLTSTLSYDPRSLAESFVPQAQILEQKLIQVILGR